MLILSSKHLRRVKRSERTETSARPCNFSIGRDRNRRSARLAAICRRFTRNGIRLSGGEESGRALISTALIRAVVR